MIADILTYIDSYDDVRALCGLSLEELKNETLALDSYRYKLGIKLESISGVYTGSTETENLVEIFARIADTDNMYGLIQLYSVAVVSDYVMQSVGLRAYKTRADGKATLTRFSPESTYHDARTAILDSKDFARVEINKLLGISSTTRSYFNVVPPAVDLVTGV